VTASPTNPHLPWHTLLGPLPPDAISASDMVLYRSPPAAPAEGAKDPGVFMRQRSIGGRFEPDGTFTGTSWHTEGPEPLDGEEPNWVSTPPKPTEEDVEALAEWSLK